jgi:hypothetical protein
MHQTQFPFISNSAIQAIKGKKVIIDYQGGNITSDVGTLILSDIERWIGIVRKLTDCITDTRRAYSIKHPLYHQILQRVLQISCGYEDVNDSNTLRKDPAFKMAVHRLPSEEDDLASQPTLSRTENMVTKKELFRIARMFVDHFIASYDKPPEVIVLDFDDTGYPVHGKQQLALFNNYYHEVCYQPLHVYEGLSGKLITTILRPGKRPNGKEIVAWLKRIVQIIRNQWSQTIIVFRGDSHYSAPEVFEYISGEENVVSVVGLTGNPKLQRIIQPIIDQVKNKPAGTRRFHSFYYQAGSWSHPRRIVAKIEMTEKGLNVRFISTDMHKAKAGELYERIYSARGNDERYIKDHKTYTKSDRTSCNRFTANQFRLFLHSAAYVLLHTLRSELLRNTNLATATFHTIRLKLLKVGARIIELKTRIKVHLPTACPYQNVFDKCLGILRHLSDHPFHRRC